MDSKRIFPLSKTVHPGALVAFRALSIDKSSVVLEPQDWKRLNSLIFSLHRQQQQKMSMLLEYFRNGNLLRNCAYKPLIAFAQFVKFAFFVPFNKC
jgi:hypothetical protein